ncbi:MAG: CAP domain-containing protein [Oscillospiraceae bacterium]|jgi:uncharacterized protein YkwD|nr:CAP domain-containing protein [Oscillospiraceae bacterium]
MSKQQWFLCLLLLAAITLMSVSALAECYPPTTDTSGQAPAFTCPIITWEQQRQLVANWPTSGTLDPASLNIVTQPAAEETLPCEETNTCDTAATCPGATCDGTCGTGCANSTACTDPATCPGATCDGTCGTGCANSTACPPSGTCTDPATCTGQNGCTEPTHQPATVPVSNPSEPNDGYYTPSALSVQEQQMVQLINQERAAQGLAALPVDLELSALAEMKSQDMVDNGYFAHESPTYGSAADMLEDAGYEFKGVGENIARSASVEKANAQFMSSDGHRRNILGSQWTKVGVGIVNDRNGYPYVTELFAR